jgi:hypothetical protein
MKTQTKLKMALAGLTLAHVMVNPAKAAYCFPLVNSCLFNNGCPQSVGYYVVIACTDGTFYGSTGCGCSKETY